MFDISELKMIEFEITTNCNAACPMCPRTNNSSLNIISWSVDEFKKILPLSLLENLPRVVFCGNLGDPTTNNDLIKMCQYIKNNSKNTMVIISTNGSLRTPKWWKELYHALPSTHVVNFAIDGLADTNHIYRVGTNFKKIMENAQAFINEGGCAAWDFIKFKHNEHQADEARTLAKKMGFSKFYLKNTSRFYGEEKFDVLDKNGKFLYFLEPPSDTPLSFLTEDKLNFFLSNKQHIDIDCCASKERSIFITAQKILLPCFALIKTANPSLVPKIFSQLIPEIDKQYKMIIDQFGGEQGLDVSLHSIESIIQSNTWQSYWKNTWKNKSLLTCLHVCGMKPKTFEYAGPMDQMINVVERLADV